MKSTVIGGYMQNGIEVRSSGSLRDELLELLSTRQSLPFKVAELLKLIEREKQIARRRQHAIRNAN